jgi:DNA modification methylase
MARGARFYLAAPAGPQGTDFRLAITEVGWTFHQALVWVKDTMVLGHSDYHKRHEDILYGWKPGEGRVGRGNHNGTRWRGDHSQTTVLDVPRPKVSTEHPTMKPVELIEICLHNSSRPDDTVLDLFGGSGSTLMACEMLRRRARLMELDPRYCDVIVKRWEEHTGRKAELVEA